MIPTAARTFGRARPGGPGPRAGLLSEDILSDTLLSDAFLSDCLAAA